MALPVLDFSDVAGLAGPSPLALSEAPGALPKLDFSDVAGIGSLGPPKTGQQKAQDIARTAGIEVAPDFGSNPVERGIADFGKGLATSLPGRLVGVVTGTSDTIGELGKLPTAQPIPFFPDMDTVGSLVGDTAMFSLVPAAAAPGKLVGAALGRATGRALNSMPLVQNALAKGAYGHVQLAQKLAGQLTGVTEDAFRAIGGTVSAGMGFGGLEKVAGGDNMDALTQGIMAGAAAGLKPAFQALKGGAVLSKMTSQRYIEAEKAIAESLDNGIGTLISAASAGRGVNGPSVAAMLEKASLEAIDPDFARQTASVLNHIAQRGGYSQNIPELRQLIPAWDDVVNQSMKGRAESALLDRGWNSAYKAWSGFTKSVDTSLRQLGPRGVQLANNIRGALDVSTNTFGQLSKEAEKALKGVTDAQLDAWVAAREIGQAPLGTANSTGLDYLAHLLDDVFPKRLDKAGIPLDGLVAGKYFPHQYDFRKLETWFRNHDNIQKLAQVTGKTYDEALDIQKSVLSNVANRASQPITTVMRSSVDLSRQLDITIAQAKALKMPIANSRAALTRYMRQVGDRVGFAEKFGADFSKGQALLDDLGAQYHSDISRDWIEKSVRKVVGMDGEIGDVSQVFSWLQNNVIVPQTLALASISNTGQSVNTIAKTGARHFLKGTAELRKEARAFAGKGGNPSEFYSTVRAVTDDIAGGMGDFLSGTEKATGLLLPKAVGRESIGSRMNLGAFFLSKTGFNGIDKWNRMAAAYSGKSWLESNVAKAVRGQLNPKQLSRTVTEFKRVGLDLNDIMRRGAMTSEELTRGAIRISDVTQFRIRPFDLPLYWSSPNAAVFRMLKTFSFNQGRFIQQEVFGQAKKYLATNGKQGSMRPMAVFLAGYPMAGYGIGSVRAILKGERPFDDQTALGTYASSMAWVGGLGLLQDFAKSADSGSKAMLQMGAGPAIGKVVDFVDAGIHSIENPRRLGRWMTRNTFPLLSQNVGGSRDRLDEALGFKDD